ncbi:MAG: alpha/beta hydrolase-fold protein, partial [Planctomycetaceae bacterium]
NSEIFKGTIREYFLYVPQQYEKSKPAAVMVFQDGHTYVSETGQFRVPVVFDNLIHQQRMPVTIGIFINPGHQADHLPVNPWKGSNRSREYDTLSDQYARFLLNEILPEVGRSYSLSSRRQDRAI